VALSRSSQGFLVVLVLLGAGFAGGLLFLRSGSAAEQGGAPVTVVVPEGVGTNTVADILAEQGVVESSLGFRLAARFDDRSARIRPGTYQLTPGMDTDQILAVLSAAPPPVPTFTVTIPEGLTVAQTLDRIATAPGSTLTVDLLRGALPQTTRPAWAPPIDQLPAEQPYPGLTPYEGLLFPDTYEFRQDQDPVSVLEELVARTEEVMAGVAVPPELTPYQVLTIASLIEREARVPEEQPTISSVIHNRIANDRLLQVDATVLYANASDADRVLNEDLEVASPWNTYAESEQILPPTPIAGAGQAAIQAAAVPQATPYLYYVVCDPAVGRHAFAETNEQHAANVARFRAGETFC